MSIVPPRKRRSYTAEYKVEAAHRVIDSERTIAEVARELGIDAGMLSVWVKDERRRIAAAEVHGGTPLEAAGGGELPPVRPEGWAGRAATVAPAGRRVGEGQRLSGKSLGVLCRDAEEPARFALMAKYAGPDEFAGAAPSKRSRFSVRRMARLLGVSTSGY